MEQEIETATFDEALDLAMKLARTYQGLACVTVTRNQTGRIVVLIRG